MDSTIMQSITVVRLASGLSVVRVTQKRFSVGGPMNVQNEYHAARENRARIIRETDCNNKAYLWYCNYCSHYAECQGRFVKARNAVRREFAN